MVGSTWLWVVMAWGSGHTGDTVLDVPVGCPSTPTTAAAIQTLIDDDAPLICLDDTVLDSTVTVSGGRTLTIRSLGSIVSVPITSTVSSPLFSVEGGSAVIFRDLILDGEGDQRLLQVLGGASVILDNIDLRNGSADEGGGVQLEGGSTLTMLGGTVESCEAIDGRGGGVNVKGGSIEVLGTEFTTNTSNDSDRGGGAIYVENGATSSVSGATFIGNQALDALLGGGALYVETGGGMTVSDSTFEGNRVDQLLKDGDADDQGDGGGAIYARRDLLIEDCTFDGNEYAGTGNGGGGGAIYAYEGDVEMRRNGFLANVAGGRGGGAVYVENSGGVIIEDCVFQENIANGPAANGGGGLYLRVDGDPAPEIRTTTFCANHSLVHGGERSSSGQIPS